MIRSGLYALYPPEPREDGVWYVTLEADTTFDEPEPNIAAMIDAIDSLSPDFRRVWSICHRREFNIGYDCGLEPWAFNQGLSNQLLGRIAAVGATLRLTLYPDRPEQSGTDCELIQSDA